jgi:hypothetical protein
VTQYVFGTGQLYAMPVGGGAPLQFGALQDVSVEFSGDIKMLYGQFQFPLDVARGKTKIEGKASTGNIDVDAFNTIFFDQTVSTGEKVRANNEADSIPATPGPYTIEVANAADFVMDLGVFDVLTGAQMRQVAASPAAGQYTVSSAGVYTFASADQGKAVLLNYIYESASTGRTLDINNELMGQTPLFQMVLTQLYKAKTFTLVLYSCVSDKMSLPLKQDDHLISELSFSAQSDALNRVGYMTTTGGA